MPKKVDRNKKNARTKEDNLALPYEAARAFNADGEDPGPAVSMTGKAGTGYANINADANVNGNVNAFAFAQRENESRHKAENGVNSKNENNPVIVLPPRTRPPQGGFQMPGSEGLSGPSLPVGEPVQQGIPGGKTYLNVKSADAEAPSQDEDTL